ncbi:MAG: hypothetical protein ACI4Q3_00660 [Kiritimatiellia bacterium]
MKSPIAMLALLAAAMCARAETAAPNIQELADRLAAVESYVATQKLERAEQAERQKQIRARAKAVQEKQKRYADGKARFEKAFAAYEEKYGQLVLVGYDETAGQRIYKRADGVTVRFTVPKAIEGEAADADTRRTRRRIKK